MPNIKEYINLSEAALGVQKIYVTPETFFQNFFNIQVSERDSFLRHILVNNVPFAFDQNPMLFEQISQYLADTLDISPVEIKLIGSAKTGFSISPLPQYGNRFNPKSDLDFSIVSEKVFLILKQEFDSWAAQYENGNLKPQNINQEKFWPQNLENCRITFSRNFIDTYKIPSHNQFATTQKINNCLFLIHNKLEKLYGMKLKGGSIRVYRTWKAFNKQLRLNTESVLEGIAKSTT